MYKSKIYTNFEDDFMCFIVFATFTGIVKIKGVTSRRIHMKTQYRHVVEPIKAPHETTNWSHIGPITGAHIGPQCGANVGPIGVFYEGPVWAAHIGPACLDSLAR